MGTPLKLINIHKNFYQGGETISILKGASLQINRGEIVALVGESGCGKSTLLQIAGLLEGPDRGEVIINGMNTKFATDYQKTLIRRHHIGFVYQFHHLLPEFNAFENVIMPLIIAGVSYSAAEERAYALLGKLDLADRLHHFPAQLSGGEQQRVAIARSLIGAPSLLLADEPTGNLDPENAELVANLLLGVVSHFKFSILLATHNMELAKKMDRVVTIEDGAIKEIEI
jgi:lipoprotein-releasing system ATP-binding protein